MPVWMESEDYNELSGRVSSSDFCGVSWYPLSCTTNREKRMFIYGTALHSATDIFAHSTYTPDGSYISHDANQADNITFKPSRDKCASYMAKLVVMHAANNQEGLLEDFKNVATSSYYDGTFKVKRFLNNIKSINPNFNIDSSILTQINLD